MRCVNNLDHIRSDLPSDKRRLRKKGCRPGLDLINVDIIHIQIRNGQTPTQN